MIITQLLLSTNPKPCLQYISLHYGQHENHYRKSGNSDFAQNDMRCGIEKPENPSSRRGKHALPLDLMQALLDLLLIPVYKAQTSPSTIQAHCHAYHKAPMRWAVFAPQEKLIFWWQGLKRSL
jgi:hypothetical protein